MRVICDAPGQTCNRLWTYVTSVAQCVAENKKMVIIFYDWTIEDFPNLLHCPFIYFPLYHKWYLERGNGWNNYKGLTWKITHNKTWDKIFKFRVYQRLADTYRHSISSEDHATTANDIPAKRRNHAEGRKHGK